MKFEQIMNRVCSDVAWEKSRRINEVFWKNILILKKFLMINPVDVPEYMKKEIMEIIKAQKSGYGRIGVCSYGYFNTHYCICIQVMNTIQLIEKRSICIYRKDLPECYLGENFCKTEYGWEKKIDDGHLLAEWLRRDKRIKTLREFALIDCTDNEFETACYLCNNDKGGLAKDYLQRVKARIRRS